MTQATLTLPAPGTSATEPNLASRLPTGLWLVLGIALTALTGDRWNIALLAWVAPVPFLVAALQLRGVRGGLLLLLALNAGYALQTLKIITAPIVWPLTFVFSIPGATTIWLVMMLWAWIARRLGLVWGLYAFVALMTLADWAGFALTYSGAWAASANSQLDDLPLLQLAAIGGLSLVGALIALVAGNIFLALDSPHPKAHWRHYAVAAAALIAALGWGAIRLDMLELGPTIRVAGVVNHIDVSHGIPKASECGPITEDLFARTEIAARRDAQLVAWNEAATLIAPEAEAAMRARGSELARRHGIDFVMAYGVQLRENPLLIDDKYEWFGPDGSVVEVYRKHHPVPTEPSLKGDAPIRVLDRPWGHAAGAICYDYDFPALAREHARGGAGLVVVPGSDWRGIDPYHTLMSRVRAIEGGMSVVRPARDGTSMMFDPYGRIRASLGAWEENEKIIAGTVPTRQVRTLYAALGDWPALVAGAFLLVALVKAWRRGRLKK